MRRAVLASIVIMGGLALSLPVRADGDPEEGKKVFNQTARPPCKLCHVVDKAESRSTGPHLVGLFGRTAGTVDDFNYSNAMEESEVVWNEETLDKYLENPRKFIKGNRMSFPGLRDEEDRENVIAYLKEVTAEE